MPIFETFGEAWGDKKAMDSDVYYNLDPEDILDNDRNDYRDQNEQDEKDSSAPPLALEDGDVGAPAADGDECMAGENESGNAMAEESTTEIEVEEGKPALMKGLSEETLIMGVTADEDGIPSTQPDPPQTPSPNAKGKRYGFYSPETQYYGNHLPPKAQESKADIHHAPSEKESGSGSTSMPPPKTMPPKSKKEREERMAELRRVTASKVEFTTQKILRLRRHHISMTDVLCAFNLGQGQNRAAVYGPPSYVTGEELGLSWWFLAIKEGSSLAKRSLKPRL